MGVVVFVLLQSFSFIAFSVEILFSRLDRVRILVALHALLLRH